MSGLNGDKSRFNRERRQKIQRRKQNRELLSASTQSQKTGPGKASKNQKREL
jgi:hypothetical protein